MSVSVQWYTDISVHVMNLELPVQCSKYLHKFVIARAERRILFDTLRQLRIYVLRTVVHHYLLLQTKSALSVTVVARRDRQVFATKCKRIFHWVDSWTNFQCGNTFNFVSFPLFRQDKQEKTKIGIKDHNSCDKLQNSLDSILYWHFTIELNGSAQGLHNFRLPQICGENSVQVSWPFLDLNIVFSFWAIYVYRKECTGVILVY